MTPPNTANYALAAAKVDAGEWVVDAESGHVLGVHRRPFVRRNSWGYVQIKFRRPDDWTRDAAVLAHRVIWEHVNGPMPNGLEINHKNGRKTDNRIDNLEAVTHNVNMQHAQATGLRPTRIGEDHPTARLTEEVARAIYARAHAGENPKDIARDYGVSRVTVSHIKCGRAWAHATAHA